MKSTWSLTRTARNNATTFQNLNKQIKLPSTLNRLIKPTININLHPKTHTSTIKCKFRWNFHPLVLKTTLELTWHSTIKWQYYLIVAAWHCDKRTVRVCFSAREVPCLPCGSFRSSAESRSPLLSLRSSQNNAPP